MGLWEIIKNAELGKTHLFAVGQAGFIVKSKSGQTLGIDLYLSDCVERIEDDHVGYKRLLPKILDPVSATLDILVCTHFHRDHFDVDAVPLLMKNGTTKLFCPNDCAKDASGLSRATFIQPGMAVESGDFRLRFVNCDHGEGAPFAVGVIVEVDNKRFLEVGDTCLRLDRQEEYLAFGPLDILIGPINGMYGNMNSNDFARLANTLHPRLSVPCHYGMFAAHHGDVGLFHEIMDTQYPDEPYLIMAQGERYTFPEEE